MATTPQIVGHSGTGWSRRGPIPPHDMSRRHQGGYDAVTDPQIISTHKDQIGHGGTRPVTTWSHPNEKEVTAAPVQPRRGHDSTNNRSRRHRAVTASWHSRWVLSQPNTHAIKVSFVSTWPQPAVSQTGCGPIHANNRSHAHRLGHLYANNRPHAHRLGHMHTNNKSHAHRFGHYTAVKRTVV